jgi:sugar phosphate isomerase/epimerase
VYSAPGLQRLRAETGPVVGANFDPSHLLWMDADPLAAIRELGDAIYHVHAKDTRIEEGRRSVRSRLETLTVDHYQDRAWNYVSVGKGQSEEFWAAFVAELAAAGYSGTLSIEHEDASVAPEGAIRDAARLLQRLVAGPGLAAT